MRVTVADPDCPATDAIVTWKVRLVAVVAVTTNDTLAFGSSVVFDELVASESALPAVSMSVTVTVVWVELPLVVVAAAGDRVIPADR